MHKYKKLSYYTAFLPFVKQVNLIGWTGLEYNDMSCDGVRARELRDSYRKGQTLALVLEDDSKLYAIV